MKIQEILKIKQHLSKSSDNDKIVLDLLQQLHHLSPTADILKQTRIGISINDIRKNTSNSTIKDTARDLITKWKKDVDTNKHIGDTLESHESTVTNSNSSPSTPNISDRSLASDNIKFTSTKNKVRDKCIELLYSALASGGDSDSIHVLKKVTLIESLVLKEFKEPDGKYKSKLRSLVSNLRDKNNPELRNSILNGSLTCERFSTMTSEEMMSKDLKKKVEEAIKVSIHEAVSASDNQAETDMFRCGKCKQRKTKYYQMQTRSADEPMTTFVTCTNCDHRWKFC